MSAMHIVTVSGNLYCSAPTQGHGHVDGTTFLLPEGHAAGRPWSSSAMITGALSLDTRPAFPCCILSEGLWHCVRKSRSPTSVPGAVQLSSLLSFSHLFFPMRN